MKAIVVFFLLNIACNSRFVLRNSNLIDYQDADTVALAIFGVNFIENEIVDRSISCSQYHNFYYKKIPDSLETFYQNILSPSLKQCIESAINKKHVSKVTELNKKKYRIKKIDDKKEFFLPISKSGYSVFYKTEGLPRYLISINDVKIGMRDNILNSPISDNAHPDNLLDILETRIRLILWDYVDNKDIINTECTINSEIKKNDLTKNDIDKHLQKVSKMIINKIRI